MRDCLTRLWLITGVLAIFLLCNQYYCTVVYTLIIYIAIFCHGKSLLVIPFSPSVKGKSKIIKPIIIKPILVISHRSAESSTPGLKGLWDIMGLVIFEINTEERAPIVNALVTEGHSDLATAKILYYPFEFRDISFDGHQQGKEALAIIAILNFCSLFIFNSMQIFSSLCIKRMLFKFL